MADASPQTFSKRFGGPGLDLALVGGVALLIRSVHLTQMAGSPVFEHLISDAAGYDAWARQIAAGDWIGDLVFYQAPLYPYFLAVIYALFGHSLLAVRVIQAVLGALACVLLAYAGRRLLGRRTGLIAGLLLATYPTAVFLDSLLQKSVLDTFFVTALLALLANRIARRDAASTAPARVTESPTTTDASAPGDDPSSITSSLAWLGLGAILGGLVLVRENALVLLPVLLLFLWLGDARSTRRRMLLTATFAVGLALPLTPVIARNLAVGGEFHLTTSQLGPNLYIGNHAGANGTYTPLVFGRGSPEYESLDARRLAEADLGRSLSAREVSSYWVGRTLDDIADDPVGWIRLMVRKALLVWNRVEMVDADDQYTHARWSTYLWLTNPWHHLAPLAALAAMGAVLSAGQLRRLWPVLALLAVYVASVVAFFVFARYRFPMVPMLMLLAAAGISELLRAGRDVWLGGRRAEAGTTTEARGLAASSGLSRARWATAWAAAVVMTVIAWLPLVSVAEVRATGLYNLGVIHLRDRQDPIAAERTFREALALQPAHALAWRGLGDALTQLRPGPEAIRAFEQAIRYRPEDPVAWHQLGRALAAVGRHDQAAQAFIQSVRLDPDDPRAWVNLTHSLLAADRLDAVTRYASLGLEMFPDNVSLLNNLGVARARMGQVEQAREAFEAALRHDPESANARDNLERLLGRSPLAP